jgi:WhiB family redox-sensing transcriptional regulator
MNEISVQARCGSADHHLFFSELPADLAAAQQICASCDVRLACLESALESGVEWGVWGGVIFWDGVAYHRRRGRGRPPRVESALPLEVSAEELRKLVRSA